MTSLKIQVWKKLSFSLPAKKLGKLHIHLGKAVRKQLKAVTSMKATLTSS